MSLVCLMKAKNIPQNSPFYWGWSVLRVEHYSHCWFKQYTRIMNKDQPQNVANKSIHIGSMLTISSGAVFLWVFASFGASELLVKRDFWILCVIILRLNGFLSSRKGGTQRQRYWDQFLGEIWTGWRWSGTSLCEDFVLLCLCLTLQSTLLYTVREQRVTNDKLYW